MKNPQMSTPLDNVKALNLISKIIHYHTIEEHKYIWRLVSNGVKTPIFVIIIDSPRFYSAHHCYYWLYKDERILDINKLQLPDHKQQSTENIRKTCKNNDRS